MSTHRTGSVPLSACDIPSPRPAERLLALHADPPADGLRVLRGIGEVDLLTTPLLRTALDDQLTARPHTLIVDFSGVTFLAACGLTALDDAARAARQQHVVLCLVATAPAVLRPLRLVDLDRVIPVHATLQQALLGGATVPGAPR